MARRPYGSDSTHNGKTAVIDGETYQLTLVADSQGETINPADVESIRELGTEISCSLLRIIELLEEAVSE
jgi:hypothetical protein